MTTTEESPLSVFISAALFLWVGFWLNMSGVSGDALYDGSVTAFTWMARIVGIGMLVVALMIIARLPIAAPLNFGMATLSAIVCIAAGGIWLAYGDQQGVLLLIFGLFNGSAARSAWSAWR